MSRPPRSAPSSPPGGDPRDDLGGDGPPAVVLGSAAEPWPVPGCRCVACASGQSAANAALRIGDATLAAGRLDAPDGSHALRAGERYETGGVRIVALPGAEPGLPAVVVGLGDGTLLWAEGRGELPEVTVDALAHGGLDGAALDIRGTGGRPDPLRLAHTLARLRAAHAVAPGCDVIAIGRTHELQPVSVERRLSWWGTRVAADGTQFGRAQAPERMPSPLEAGTRRTLVLGPASSGKSAAAEDLLAAEPAVVYAATGPAPAPHDRSWVDRVATHRARRPSWWATDESGDVARLVAQPGPPLLVDALGTWLAGAMDRAGAWEDARDWRTRIEGEVDAVVAAWRQAQRRVVAVGEEVGWGVVPVEPGVAAFRELLGDLAQRLAAESERVLVVVAGRVTELR